MIKKLQNYHLCSSGVRVVVSLVILIISLNHEHVTVFNTWRRFLWSI